MRKRSEAKVEAAPVVGTFPAAGTACAVCKRRQFIEMSNSTHEVTCENGHRGAFGLFADGTKIDWLEQPTPPLAEVMDRAKAILARMKNENTTPPLFMTPESALPTTSTAQQSLPMTPPAQPSLIELQERAGAQASPSPAHDASPRRNAAPAPEAPPPATANPGSRPAPAVGKTADIRKAMGLDEPEKPRGGLLSDHPDIPLAEVGDTVTVTWGEEMFSPVQYNNFRVGPFMATTKIRVGETAFTASRRALFELSKLAEVEFETKATAYLQRLATVGKKALATRGG